MNSTSSDILLGPVVMRKAILLTTVALGFFAFFAVTSARADDAPSTPADASRATCVSAYESVQIAMKRSLLSEAREHARTCLSPVCSASLQPDCAAWLAEIDTKQPSFVVRYRDRRGTSRTDVAVFVDGRRIADSIDGRGVPVDPGAHVVRIEPALEGPLEARRVFTEGAKLEMVDFAGTPAFTLPVEPTPLRRPTPLTAWLAAGVGTLGAASFATFAIWGKTGQNSLDESCKPTCPEPDVARVHARYVVADVSLGVSLVGFASAALFYFFRPTPRPERRTAGLTRHDRATSNPDRIRNPVALNTRSLRPHVQSAGAGFMVGVQGVLP